jgi:hypothetical protein
VQGDPAVQDADPGRGAGAGARRGAGCAGTPPSGTDLRRWAPFTLLAAAPGDVVHLAESTDKLLGTLPMWAFSHPFQWRFDDGATAAGTSVTHRFITLGWHSFSVSYYWPARKRWVQFDSARLQIVTAGDLWKANLGYNVGKVFQIVVRLLIWATLAGLVVLAVWRWRGQARPGGRRAGMPGGGGL